ncbi:MAG: amylo-alpha-1,6-glucosidase [Arachnia sp.]
MLHLSPSEVSDGHAPVQREWLVTNGIGGYAMGTVNGARTRGYHGLLVATLEPPVGRWLVSGGLADVAEIDGVAHRLTGEAVLDAEGVVHVAPPSAKLSFRLEDGTPVWSLETSGALLEKRIFMAHGRNTTYVHYLLRRADAPVTIRAEVTAALRDHHQLSRATAQPIPGADQLRILADGADVRPANRWRLGEYLAIEDERGFDCVEDEHVVAVVEGTLQAGQSLTFAVSTEDEGGIDGEAALAAHRERAGRLLAAAGADGVPDDIAQLVLAADQFVVRRRLADGADGHSVIAGYPWFGDWGRDTMIALPGLTLATGRSDVARGILTTFARYVDRGMLPNRFPDSGDEPEYNTADATLWYFEAVRAFHAATGDDDTLRELFPVLADIVDQHLAGTRYGIGVDPADGLLRAGEPGQNLTWMDAKVDGVVMTPRHGKPVELSALWINALAAMRGFATRLGEPDRYTAPLAQASAGFARFWDDQRGYLLDVLDPADPTLRPNQLIAAALPTVPLTADQRAHIVDACKERLYTPFGMRTVAPDDPNYRGIFRGGPKVRDAMYHQGPAWSWLLGPFISAHLRAFGDRAAARGFVLAALEGLGDGCVGSISELFDGDAPHRPRAACAQAWGVSELLRAWREVEEWPGADDSGA